MKILENQNSNETKKIVNALEMEGLFLLGGIICQAFVVIVAKKTGLIVFDENLINGLGLSLVFSVINIRAWKLLSGMLIVLSKQGSAALSKPVIFLIIALKLSLILLVVPLLLLVGDGLVVPFLIGFGSYLFGGLFLLQLSQIVRNRAAANRG